ncbi:hypothetical protein [Salinicola avicenniae]|uniref:hypothetical protein n=1 Tax=Salinicola avicenniae TaxID=2916836 RepID=UPI0020741B48|nr:MULTISPECIES: hypothetical protein [unclassified Salinicola]
MNEILSHERRRPFGTLARRMAPRLALALVVASGMALPSLSVLADGVAVADPQTGQQIRLPDRHHNGHMDDWHRQLDVHVMPGMTGPRDGDGYYRDYHRGYHQDYYRDYHQDYDRDYRREGDGGTICHGDDGNTTISTESRRCDPGATAGDGGPRVRNGSPSSPPTGN